MAFPNVASPAATDVPLAIMLNSQRVPKAVVQLMRRSYLWYRMKQAGDHLAVNGPNIEIPFYIGEPVLGDWIGYDDELPDGYDIDLYMGYATQRYVVVPMTHNLLKQWENEANPTKLLDEQEFGEAQAAWAMRSTLCDGLWNGAGGKEPDGIANMIEAAAPGSQTAVVTGVNKATQSWARNPVVQLTTNFGYLAPGTRIPAGFLAMDSLISQSTVGTVRPSDMVMTKASFDTVVRGLKEMADPRRLMTHREHYEHGIESVIYDGVILAWDDKCPSDSVFTFHVGENVQEAVVNHQNPGGAKYDPDLELSGGKHRFLELNSSFGFLGNPSVSMRRIDNRYGYRSLRGGAWMVHAFNPFFTRPSENARGYSDNGSRWSTW
jgi:hypothetical protein